MVAQAGASYAVGQEVVPCAATAMNSLTWLKKHWKAMKKQ
jgi:hypothetical protein